MKGKVVHVGSLDERGFPTGFVFDCSQGPPVGLDLTGEKPLLAGYTVEELISIAQERAGNSA